MDCVEVDVFQVARRRGRGLLILVAVASVALSGCGSGSKPSAPSGSVSYSGTPTSQPTTTAQPTGQATIQPTDTSGTGVGLDGATSALASITSCKIKMTVVGGDDDLNNTLSSIPNAPDSGVFKVTGTFVFKPSKAADITVAGILHDISVGGNDYQEVGLQGTFTEDESGASTLTNDLSPAAIYSAFDFTTGFDFVATETKDGVDADHYHAGDTALAEFASIAGVVNATWTADVWIARTGGYPVSIAIIATASDNSIAYERAFDLTEVNAATNKVTAPTNVSGA